MKGTIMDGKCKFIADLLANTINAIVLAFKELVDLTEGELKDLYDDYSNIVGDQIRLAKNAKIFMWALVSHSSIVIHDEKFPVSLILEMGVNKESAKLSLRRSSKVAQIRVQEDVKDMFLREEFIWVEKPKVCYFVETTASALGISLAENMYYEMIKTRVERIGGIMCPPETALILAIEKADRYTGKNVMPLSVLLNGQILWIRDDGVLGLKQSLEVPEDTIIIFQVEN